MVTRVYGTGFTCPIIALFHSELNKYIGPPTIVPGTVIGCWEYSSEKIVFLS